MKRDTKATLEYLSRVAGKKKGYMFALLAVQAVLGASGILYALLLRNIVDAAVDKQPTFFLYYVLAFAALVLLQIGFRALLRHLDELSRANLENCFKARLFSVLFSKNYGEVSSVHSAEWMNELTTDTVIVADGLTGILPGFAGMLIRLIGAICALLVLEPRFLYLIMPGGILLILFSWLFRKKMKKLHKNVRESDGELRTTLQEGLSNMLVVRSYAAEDEIEKSAFVGMDAHKGARMKRIRFSNLANIGFGIMMSGAYVVGVAFCGHGILTGAMSYGTLMAVMQLIAQVQAPLANISGFLPRFYSMTASAERLMEAEKLEEQRAENALTAGEIRNFYENDFSGLGFDKVGFAYSEGEAAVLTDFSLRIKKGGCTAFTGISGCGKSTALKLLLGLYNVKSGKVYISNQAGNEITDILKYQRLFAYVPQGNYLMTGTIREVVSFADRSRMDDENKLREALKIACADEFVDNLETGVNAVLGERGSGLSEGQAQRLAIARAIFSDRPVLLLDECTSALDEATERRLLNNLKKMTDKTVIIVTHRPAALEICDSVVKFAN